MSKQLRVVTWNMHSAGRMALMMVLALRRLIRRTKRPHVLALQEAKHLDRHLRGYNRVKAQSKRPESGNCLLYVRADGHVVDTGKLEVNGKPWKGVLHKDVEHAPRVYPFVSVKFPGHPIVTVMSVHRAPGGHDAFEDTKRAAWAAEDRDLENWVTEQRTMHLERPVLLVGDHNDTAKERGPLTLRSLAHRVAGVLRLEHIDGVIAVGAGAFTHRLNRKFGSDHRPVVISVNTEE